MAGSVWWVLGGAVLAGVGLGCGDTGREAHPLPPPVIEAPQPPPTASPPVVEPQTPSAAEPPATPSAACDGLMPQALGAPETRDFSPPPNASQVWCSSFDVDGQGTLTWTRMEGNTNMGYAAGVWTNLDAQGQVLGQREERVLLDDRVAADSGFLSVEGMASLGYGKLVVVRPDASTVTIPRRVGWGHGYAVAAHARHGLASLERSTEYDEPGALMLQAYDVSGQPRFAAVEVAQAPAGVRFDSVVGIDDEGRLLVLWKRETEPGMRGRWYGADGQPLTEAFDAPVPESVAGSYGGFVGFGTLAPLRGGLVLRDREGWGLLFPSAEARAEPAPAWLVARPATDFWRVRGGRAYAVRSRGGSYRDAKGEWAPAPCPDHVELLTLEGESCGTIRLPAADGSCGARLDVGADGTLIQQEDCRASLWPGLLR